MNVSIQRIQAFWNGRSIAARWAIRIAFGIFLLTSLWTYQAWYAGVAHSAYTISNSARFVSANSDSLTRSVTASNRKTFTISFWFKRGTLNTLQYLVNGSSTQGGGIGLDQASGGFCSAVGDQMLVAFNGSVVLCTSALFRDPAAWTHAVLAVDTTQATAANRVKLYINGSQVTAFTTASYPAQNTDLNWNNTDTASIGRLFAATYFFDGNMADVYNIDGAQLPPTCFGATDANGYWRPITYSTASPCAAYGTNGFHLLFGNGASLGTDSAGSNNWTVNGLVAADQVTDSPTNSFATLSPIDDSNGTFTQGNLRHDVGVASATEARGTIYPSSGKWYCEFSSLSGTSGFIGVGVVQSSQKVTNPTSQATVPVGMWVYRSDGFKINNGSGTNLGTTYNNTTDVVGVAWDVGAGKVWFSKNNTWVEGNPASGTTPSYSNLTGSIAPLINIQGTNGTPGGTINCGQGGQSGLTFDSASGGTFKYTPPSGFKALSTANMAAPAIAVPRNYFNAIAYAGSGATQSIVGGAGGTVGTTVKVYLTAGSAWAVPSDWNSSNNTIEVVGGGGAGGAGAGPADSSSGGGGGAYSKISNLALTPGGTVTYQVGAGGASAGAAGGDTYFNGTGSTCSAQSVCAQGGAGGLGSAAADRTASGGAAGSGVGTVKFSGGDSGTAFTASNNDGGSGGGGAAGPSGAGARGGNGASAAPASGGGGGGANNGSAGSNGIQNGNGGAGGNGVSGSGGGTGGTSGTPAGGAGTGGGGGGGGYTNAQGNTGGSGGSDSAWDGSHGSGGGGGGGGSNGGSLGSPVAIGGPGALYGGGGGGRGGSGGTPGLGAQGIIVITYVSTGLNIGGFQPDLVWIKDRTSANAHGIFDSTRTATKYWSSNASTAETTDAQSLATFNTNGFSLGTQALFNTSGNNYVAWVWKKCPAISGLTCLAADGVDIVTYSGDNTANRNISHSLGAVPDMVIVKRRDSAGDPYVWHSSLTGATYFTLLDSTAAQSNTSSPWGTGNFSSTQFMVTNDATNNTNYNNTGICGAAGFTLTGGVCKGYLTSGTSWTVPSDWNSSNNTIEVIGGGGGGGTDYSARVGGGGGGGGGYAKATNVTLTAGVSVAYVVGAAGTGGASGAANNGTSGGDTYFCNSASNCASISGTAVKVGAKGGAGGIAQSSTNAGGGAASSAVGGVGGGTANPGAPYAYTGGQGGGGSTGSASLGGGGGGAGGPGGAGGAGANDTPTGTANNGGNGGGGGGGGTAGTTATPGASIGGAGGNGNSGATGGAGGTSGTHAGGVGGSAAGSSGGGGGGGWGSNVSTDGDGGSGGTGMDWDSSHGSGGGGASHGYFGGQPGNGGLYGGGGSGGSDYYLNTTPAGGNGAQGIIAISYTPVVNVGTYVAYLFKSVDGFSKFGSYTGNGSADGPFIYTGFKPRFLMLKATGAAENWHVVDTTRSAYNVAILDLFPNDPSAETSSNVNFDFLSNGFKLRNSTGEGNVSGRQYIYAAFADQPFYYSAQPAAASTFSSGASFLMGMTY